MKKKIVEELYGISATSIEKYLLLNGWKRDYSFNNKKMMVFENEQDSQDRIAFPASEKYIDFYPKVNDMLETLSFYSQKDIEQIVKEMKATNGKEHYKTNFEYLGCCDQIVVIGNILDNPELLER